MLWHRSKGAGSVNRATCVRIDHCKQAELLSLFVAALSNERGSLFGDLRGRKRARRISEMPLKTAPPVSAERAVCRPRDFPAGSPAGPTAYALVSPPTPRAPVAATSPCSPWPVCTPQDSPRHAAPVCAAIPSSDWCKPCHEGVIEAGHMVHFNSGWASWCRLPLTRRVTLRE
jgi:hypothetical protein